MAMSQNPVPLVNIKIGEKNDCSSPKIWHLWVLTYPQSSALKSIVNP